MGVRKKSSKWLGHAYNEIRHDISKLNLEIDRLSFLRDKAVQSKRQDLVLVRKKQISELHERRDKLRRRLGLITRKFHRPARRIRSKELKKLHGELGPLPRRRLKR